MAFARFRHFLKDTRAVAAVEAGFLFPLMVTILCGTIDVGMGLIVNMKVTNAAQVVSDLVARGSEVSNAEISDSIVAGRMALLPYNTATFGVDIVGIQYVGVALTPTVRWRETSNMAPNNDVLEKSEGLGLQNEGVVAVTVQYVYVPYFSHIIVGDMTMGEEAFVRGRKGLFVERTT